MLQNLEQKVKFGGHLHFQSSLGDPFKVKSPRAAIKLHIQICEHFGSQFSTKILAVCQDFHKLQWYFIQTISHVNQLNVKFAHDCKSKFTLHFSIFLTENNETIKKADPMNEVQKCGCIEQFSLYRQLLASTKEKKEFTHQTVIFTPANMIYI